MKKTYPLLILLIILFGSCATKKQVDLIVKNAKIYKVNENFDTASVMIVNKGKIEAVGGDSLLESFTSENTIDAKGKYIYPGFIDAHCHFTGHALDAYKLNLFGTKSFDEVIQKVIEYSKSNRRQWIEGRGWDQNDWTNKTFPTKDTLDKLFPDTPVFLLRVDGHAVLLNQKALDITGISYNTKVEGGEVEIKNAKLTGILIDNAMDLAKKKLPALTPKESEDFILASQEMVFALGLTSVVDPGVEKNTVDWLKDAHQKGKLKLRVTLMLSNEKENLDYFLKEKPFKNDWLHVAGFKLYIDGALGSRGAFLLNEYSDRHQHAGALLSSRDSLEKVINRIAQSEYQVCSHAIGDGGNRTVLELYAKALQKKNDRRWRIEHAQVLDKNDMHLFGDYDIIPCVQPTHATSDMYWAEDRIGPGRIKGAYAYKELLQQNHWLPLGTDFPVEELNPLNTFCAAVFRQDKNSFPEGGFQMENALSREEALRGMTIWAAKSVFEENEKGSLEKGKFADFTILDIDLMKAGIKEIYDAKVNATYVNGVKMTK